MKLAALFSEKNILIHMTSATYPDAISELVGSLGENLGRLAPEMIRERLLEVEAELPMSPGHGVRIPHARLAGLNRLLMAIGTSVEGIPIDPAGREMAHLIFLVLTPKTQSTVMLQTLSSIARLVSVESNRKAMISTTAPARLLRILEESGIQVKKAIVTADLMNLPMVTIRPDATLRQVAQTLSFSEEEGLPVVSEEGELLGDISTRMVIEVGLPKYMNLISDPQVLSEFEPFEAFYRKEDTLTAREVMNPGPLCVEPDTPVEILAHEMITKRSERAYVVDDKQLVGVVYRKDIVRKVLNL